MAWHWSYDTPQNKMVYGIIITFLVIGKCLIAAGVIGGYASHSCLPHYRSCTNSGNDSSYCTREYDYCHIKTWINLIVAGVIVCAVGLSCSAWMCFCSMPPRRNPPQAIVMGPLLPGNPDGPQQPSHYSQVPTQVMGIPVMGYPAPMYPQPSHQTPFLVASVGEPPQQNQPSETIHAPASASRLLEQHQQQLQLQTWAQNK